MQQSNHGNLKNPDSSPLNVTVCNIFCCKPIINPEQKIYYFGSCPFLSQTCSSKRRNTNDKLHLYRANNITLA